MRAGPARQPRGFQIEEDQRRWCVTSGDEGDRRLGLLKPVRERLDPIAGIDR
jgi:hypothetical protein